MEVDKLPWSSGVAYEQRMDSTMSDDPNLNPIPRIDEDSSDFGAWLKPQNRKGSSRGRGQGGMCNPSPGQ